MFTRNDAIAAETLWARRLGVPEQLAHAIAGLESGHNPYAKGDFVNGEPTSFGDYQLHRGGELGSLTPAQAYDPNTNARVALTELRHVMQTHPYVTDPGQLAALAQRPGNPRGYAMSIDAAMHVAPQSGGGQLAGAQLAGFDPTFGAGGWVWDKASGAGGWVLHGVGNAAGDVGGAIAAPFVAIFNLMHAVWTFLTSENTWIRVGLFVGGLVFVVIGARVAFL